MKKLCVIGYPIEHSLSPPIHNAALKELGLDNEYSYKKIKVAPESLGDFVDRVRNGEIHGASVTIPHKMNIMPHLDTLTDEAQFIGAVNTVYMKDGKIVGDNTDGIGFVASLEDSVKSGSAAVLLGAGGAARAIAYSLSTYCDSITVVNRDLKRREQLTMDLAAIYKKVNSSSLDQLPSLLPDANLLVNCTPIGMRGDLEGQTLATADMMHPDLVVVDIVYVPRKTRLLQEAEKAGAHVITGEGMFIYQAAEQFLKYTGYDAPIKVMKQAFEEALDS